jgi:mannose-6-phosphate isomerase-like protein (cupin superfamily)
MIKQDVTAPVRTGKNYSAVNIGRLGQLDEYELDIPTLKRKARGKLFIRDLLSLSSMQISMNKLPAGAAVPFLHRHRENEEVHIFIGGTGQMQIDGDILPVGEGSIVRISTTGNRGLRNTAQEPLFYICIQAREGSLNVDTFDDGIVDTEPVKWPQ